jgi:hypothetical protein
VGGTGLDHRRNLPLQEQGKYQVILGKQRGDEDFQSSLESNKYCAGWATENSRSPMLCFPRRRGRVIVHKHRDPTVIGLMIERYFGPPGNLWARITQDFS